jgi:hypothetical protein
MTRRATQSSVTKGQKEAKRSPVAFFLLVLVLSVPIWALGAAVQVGGLPLNLPTSAVALPLVPASAAAVLVSREESVAGVRRLLARALDVRRTPNAGWYLVAVFLMPALYVLTFLVSRWMGAASAVGH